MQFGVDVRLAAAAGGAARYFADAAGLGQDAVNHLQDAVIAACEEAFEDIGAGPYSVDVTLTWLADRIEVAVSHQRAATAAANPKVESGAGTLERMDGIDEVQHETRNGVVLTRLTKFLKQGAARR